MMHKSNVQLITLRRAQKVPSAGVPTRRLTTWIQGRSEPLLLAPVRMRCDRRIVLVYDTSCLIKIKPQQISVDANKILRAAN